MRPSPRVWFGVSAMVLSGLLFLASAYRLVPCLLVPPSYQAVSLIDLSGAMEDLRITSLSLPRQDEAAWLHAQFERLHARIVWFPVITNLDLGRSFAEEFHESSVFTPETVYVLLRKRVNIRQRDRAVMAIAVRSPSAAGAAAIANEIAIVYRDQRAAQRRDSALRGIQALEAALAQMTNSAAKEKLRAVIEREKARSQSDNSGVSILEQATPPARPIPAPAGWIGLGLALGVTLGIVGIRLLNSRGGGPS